MRTTLDKATNALLIIDGVDEAPYLEDFVHRSIAGWTSDGAHNRYVITSRAPSPDVVVARGTLLEHRLLPLTEFQAARLLRYTGLDENYFPPHVADLLGRNPLVLSLATNWLKDGHSVVELLERFKSHSLGSGIIVPGVAAPSEGVLPNETRIRVQQVSNDIMLALAARPEGWYELSSRRYEEIVAELLGRLGYEIQLTAHTRDGGRDILALEKRPLGSFLYLVECKRNAPTRPVGVEVVRQLYGTVHAEHANAGVIATTSRFTSPAQEFAARVRFQLTLRDYFAVQDWLREAIVRQ
jgi:restriction system protein